MPCLKIQGANIMNRIPSGMFKGSCIGTKDNEGDESKDEPKEVARDGTKERSDLQRRTVDTKHISTVSSLVTSKTETDLSKKSTKDKDSQRNNFGLYALKFHRNLAARANNVILNFKSDNLKRSKSTKNNAEQPSAPNNELKHEYFEACGHSIESAHYNYNETDEYCKIELNDDHSMNIHMNRSNSFDTNTEQMTFKQRTIAPVRPRRMKSNSPNPNSMVVSETNKMKKPQNSIKSRFVAYENAPKIDEKWSEDDSVLNIWTSSLLSITMCVHCAVGQCFISLVNSLQMRQFNP